MIKQSDDKIGKFSYKDMKCPSRTRPWFWLATR